MKSFKCFVSNGKYAIGCTGGSVYVYGSDKNEIARFRDIRAYVYRAVISPDGKVFAVKSTEAWLAVYSLETMSLIKKFRFQNAAVHKTTIFLFLKMEIIL